MLDKSIKFSYGTLRIETHLRRRRLALKALPLYDYNIEGVLSKLKSC